MRACLLVIALIAAPVSSGCLKMLTDSPTEPTPVSVEEMVGTWGPVAPPTSRTETCTDFHWTITERTTDTASGSFAATCTGLTSVAGTASGTLSGTRVGWTATATGTRAGADPCAVSLAGTGTFDGRQLRIPFTGTTCVGPVTGAEILRKGGS